MILDIYGYNLIFICLISCIVNKYGLLLIIILSINIFSKLILSYKKKQAIGVCRSDDCLLLF